MTGEALAAAALCVVACGVLVLSERRQWRRARTVAKITASLAFIAVGAIVMFGSERPQPEPTHTWYRNAIGVGLVLGLIGDVALLGGKRGFMLGLLAFLLGHVAYIVAFTQFQAYLGVAMLVPIAIGALA